MKNIIKKIFIGSIIFILAFISVYNVISRVKWESKKKIFFVVDIDYFLVNNISFQKIKEDLSDNLFFCINYNFFFNIKHFDKKIIFKLNRDTRYDLFLFLKCVEAYKDKIFSIIFSYEKNSYSLIFQNLQGKKITNQELRSFLEEYNFVKLNFESDEEKIYSKKISSIRSFILDLNINKEIPFSRQIELALLKTKKAIIERSCCLVYILPSEYLSYSENVNMIKMIVSNFTTEDDTSKIETFKTISFGKINNFLVLFLSIIIPLIIYKNISISKLEFKELIYIKTNFLTLLLGVFIWGFMQKYEYVVLEEKFVGAKLMFFLPVVLSVFFVFDEIELKKISQYEIKLKDIFIVLFIGIIFGYIFLRTGNVGKEFVLKYELYLREIIEKRILFRPRFKEIFFAQPLFLLSLFLMKKYNKKLWTKELFCISILSQVSIINTFLHIHTPINLCILRSIIGIFLGLIIGEVIIFIFGKLKITKAT